MKKEEFINLPLIGIYPYSIAKFIAIEEVAIKNMSNWNIEKLLGVPAVRASLPPPPFFPRIMLCYNQAIFSVKWFKERPIQTGAGKKEVEWSSPTLHDARRVKKCWPSWDPKIVIWYPLVLILPPICCHFLQRLLKIKICWECHKLNEWRKFTLN